MPETPYVGMPTAISGGASVPPAWRIGTTGTPGHIWAETFSIGPRTLGVSGGGPTTASLRPSAGDDTETAGSAASLISVWRTSSRGTPGKIRQLISAVARCGRAL